MNNTTEKYFRISIEDQSYFRKGELMDRTTYIFDTYINDTDIRFINIYSFGLSLHDLLFLDLNIHDILIIKTSDPQTSGVYLRYELLVTEIHRREDQRAQTFANKFKASKSITSSTCKYSNRPQRITLLDSSISFYIDDKPFDLDNFLSDIKIQLQIDCQTKRPKIYEDWKDLIPTFKQIVTSIQNNREKIQGNVPFDHERYQYLFVSLEFEKAFMKREGQDNIQGRFAPIIKIGTTSQGVEKRLTQCKRNNIFGECVDFSLLLCFPSKIDDEKKVKDLMDNNDFRNIQNKASTEYYLASRRGFFNILSYYCRQCSFRKDMGSQSKTSNILKDQLVEDNHKYK